MKKTFLLTLIGVFFLSAFGQTVPASATELIAKINVVKHVDDDEISKVAMGWWLFAWREVKVEPVPGGLTITCIGRGWNLCMLRFADWKEVKKLSDAVIPVIHEAYVELITESDERMANGTRQGSHSKKVAFLDPQTNKQSYFILQMTWDNDPQKPYNGKAEISIYKTNNLGF